MSESEASEILIRRDMTIQEVFECAPGKAPVLAHEMAKAGLHCVGCGAATHETVEEGMKGHGMEEEEIDSLVERLNAILLEDIKLDTVRLTPIAAEKFRKIAKEEGKEGCALRFGEIRAGCSGFEYTLDFSDHADEDDSVFTSEGVDIHIRNTSLDRLLGCTIDYVEGLAHTGFKITNPNVRSSCGCGSSHSY